MIDEKLDARRGLHFRLSSAIAALSNAEVEALLGAGDGTPGWGTHQTVDVAGEPVFVKRIPVTELEYEHAFSTRNMYDLPLYYNYGVGSAGFGAFRELLTQVKTSNWVLEGASPSFPLLYHYRLMPFAGERAVLDEERRNGYVRYWGGSESVGRYLDARMRAKHDLVLFIEHVPHVLHTWLTARSGDCAALLGRLRDAITFLRTQGIVHFDAHFQNVLTDGSEVYLSDFGLAMDRGFDLTSEERELLQAHEYYDYGEILWSLGWVVADRYQQLPDEVRRDVMSACGMTPMTASDEAIGPLARNIERLHGVIALDPGFVEVVGRHRDVIVLMNDFFASMHRNNAKDTRLDLARLRDLLAASGFA
jgi:hypothetical protein